MKVYEGPYGFGFDLMIDILAVFVTLSNVCMSKQSLQFMMTFVYLSFMSDANWHSPGVYWLDMSDKYMLNTLLYSI